MSLDLLIIIVFLVLFTSLFFSVIKTVPGKMEYIVERLGRYHRTLYSGNNLILPFIDRIVKKVRKNEMVLDFPPHFAVTKDKAEVKAGFVIYFQVIDSLKYVYIVENPIQTLENLCIVMFKDVISKKKLQELEVSRDIVNEGLRNEFNEKADFLGIKINKAELKKVVVIYENIT